MAWRNLLGGAFTVSLIEGCAVLDVCWIVAAERAGGLLLDLVSRVLCERRLRFGGIMSWCTSIWEGFWCQDQNSNDMVIEVQQD